MSDSIRMAALPRSAYSAIRDLCECQGWPDIHAWMEPQDFLLLIERLKRTPDSKDVFPMGKEATIRSMQKIFEDGFSVD